MIYFDSDMSKSINTVVYLGPPNYQIGPNRTKTDQPMYQIGIKLDIHII